jgi:hypothetical protein
MNNNVPKQYRVDENGDLLDSRPTLINAAFAGAAMLAVAVLLDYTMDDCGYVRQFLNDDCVTNAPEQGQAVSAGYPSLLVG